MELLRPAACSYRAIIHVGPMVDGAAATTWSWANDGWNWKHTDRSDTVMADPIEQALWQAQGEVNGWLPRQDSSLARTVASSQPMSYGDYLQWLNRNNLPAYPASGAHYSAPGARAGYEEYNLPPPVYQRNPYATAAYRTFVDPWGQMMVQPLVGFPSAYPHVLSGVPTNYTNDLGYALSLLGPLPQMPMAQPAAQRQVQPAAQQRTVPARQQPHNAATWWERLWANAAPAQVTPVQVETNYPKPRTQPQIDPKWMNGGQTQASHHTAPQALAAQPQAVAAPSYQASGELPLIQPPVQMASSHAPVTADPYPYDDGPFIGGQNPYATPAARPTQATPAARASTPDPYPYDDGPFVGGRNPYPLPAARRTPQPRMEPVPVPRTLLAPAQPQLMPQLMPQLGRPLIDVSQLQPQAQSVAPPSQLVILPPSAVRR